MELSRQEKKDMVQFQQKVGEDGLSSVYFNDNTREDRSNTMDIDEPGRSRRSISTSALQQQKARKSKKFREQLENDLLQCKKEIAEYKEEQLKNQELKSENA
jgi:hypothetical protein